MADKPIDQRVKDIIVEQLGVKPEQVTPEAKFIEDLGADSLDKVELIKALEEEFGVEGPDEKPENLLTDAVAPFWKNLIFAERWVGKIASFAPRIIGTQIAAEVKNFDPTPAFPSPKD